MSSGLDDLDARIRAAREAREKGRRAAGNRIEDRRGFSLAVRAGTELVAALLVGAGIGWGLDQWLGTAPWLLIVFFMLGSAAGVVNVWRVASGQDMGVGYGGRSKESPPESADTRDKQD